MGDEVSCNNRESKTKRSPSSSNFLLGAYLVHLLVPLLLLVDSLRAALRGEAGTLEKAIMVVGGAWVVLGLVAWAQARDKERFLRRAAGPLVSLYTLVFCLGLAELGVRVAIRHFNRVPLARAPGSKMVLDLTQWHMIGVSPKITFTVNALGLRGPLPATQGRNFKIIAVGGSTTECGALDDTEEWPHLLMELMNSRQKKYFTWVNNAGVSGLTTVDHLSCLRRIPILSQVDLLVFLIGVNDLEASLEYGGAPTQQALERRAELFAEHAPYGVMDSGGFFRRLWLYAMTREVLRNMMSRLKHSSSRQPPMSEQSERRAAGPMLPLPDLRIGLQEYGLRIRRLDQECRARRLRCVFLTQPSIWRADLSREEQQLLWFGKIGGRGHVLGYASVGDLASAMDAYNQALLSICRQDHLECYDLASVIPKDTSAFYDDVHFNIGGARRVAEFLAAHLLASPPFHGDPP